METKYEEQEEQENAIVDNYYRGCRPYVVGGISYGVALIVIWIWYNNIFYPILIVSLVICFVILIYKDKVIQYNLSDKKDVISTKEQDKEK